MRLPGAMVALAFLVCAVGGFAIAPAPQSLPDPPKEEVGPVEINFAPLPSMSAPPFKIHMVAQAEGGASFKETFTFTGAFHPADVRELVTLSLESVKWKVKRIEKSRLIIEGHKDKPLKSLELRVEGLPKENHPTVRRVLKKDDEKGK